MVVEFRKKTKDRRKFPQFVIGTLSHNGSRGKVHLYWKKRGKEAYISKRSIYYESIPELAFIIENLGKAWSATSP
jgi:hypothetical protein